MFVFVYFTLFFKCNIPNLERILFRKKEQEMYS